MLFLTAKYQRAPTRSTVRDSGVHRGTAEYLLWARKACLVDNAQEKERRETEGVAKRRRYQNRNHSFSNIGTKIKRRTLYNAETATVWERWLCRIFFFFPLGLYTFLSF